MNTFVKSLILTLMIAGASLFVFGQAPTAAGTDILNTATATFTDSNGTDRNSTSNTVTTTVQAVYSFNVEPDDANDPSGGSAASTDFSLDPDATNDKTADASDTIVFSYDLENLSNTDIDVALSIGVDPANTFTASSIEIYVDDDPSTADAADGDGDGIPDNYVLYDSLAKPNLPRNDGTNGSGDDFLKVFVKIGVPAAALGNQVAKFDLQATNDSAVTALKTGPNVSYENNNIGRIEINEDPSIGVAKAATLVTNNGDGTYDVDYTVTIENFGNVDLSYIQATEDLATTFAAATAWSVKGAPDAPASGDFAVNPAFDGNANKDLLTTAAGNSLVVGASGTITFTVLVEPGSTLGSYDNTVVVQGSSPDDVADGAFDPANPTATVTDDSTDGLDPDQDGDDTNGSVDDDGTPDETSPTPVTFTENPVLGVAKAATAAVDAAGFPGQFETTITFTVENMGDVELRNLQVTDDLDTAFELLPLPASAVTYTVTAISSANLSENASFDGSGDQDLLDGTDTLAVGQTETIEITVRFDPNGETGPFDNQAVGTATSPAGPADNVTDDSTDGTDPDPDNVNGPDENDPTPISFTENPVIGVAKDATVTDADTDSDPLTNGPYDVRFDFYLENFGNVNVSSLTLADDLDATFGAGNYSVTAAPSLTTAPATSTINLNAGFDGSADQALIAAGSNLDVGETAMISITVRLSNPGAYTNVATAAGVGPGGTATNDDSTDGTNPDPNGDDDPTTGDLGNPDEDEPTPINLDALQLAKSARVCADADCLTVTDATGADVEPGQYIEYTIVASNVGGQGLTNVIIFDELPTWLLPVAGNAHYADSANTSVGIECSINGGVAWAACPAGTSSAVTDVRLSVGNLAALATETLTFVVYIP